MEALPGSTFGKKTQVRESLSRKDQENMIARSNRAFQTIVDLGQPDRIGLGDSVVQVGAILASRVDADGNMVGDLFGFDPK